jgi:subtilisin family serine protease
LTSCVLFLSSNAFAAGQSWYENEYYVTFRQSTSRSTLSTHATSDTGTVIHWDSSSIGLRSTSSERRIVPYDATQNACAEIMKSMPDVATCDPEKVIKAFLTPNDARYSELHGLNNPTQLVDIDAPEAWDISTGSAEVVVAVLDTGMDIDHPDLVDNLWTNTGEVPNNGVDDDGNGYIDDVNGWDFVNDDNDPSDDNGHGTHLSGTIGARGNNSGGVVGVNWIVKILPLKFLGAEGNGSLSGAVAGLNYARALKARGVNIVVVNCSFGSSDSSTSESNAIQGLRDAGVFIAAAAGNESENNDNVPSYPASYNLSNVISVAAVNRQGSLASFSNFGSSVDIGAPGVDILSTYPDNTYEVLDGTSMAAPHVAGALALLETVAPNLTLAEARSRLLSTARVLPGLNGVVASGRYLNVLNLLTGTEGGGGSDGGGGDGGGSGGLTITASGAANKVSNKTTGKVFMTVSGTTSESSFLIGLKVGRKFCDDVIEVDADSDGTVVLRGTLPASPKNQKATVTIYDSNVNALSNSSVTQTKSKRGARSLSASAICDRFYNSLRRLD